MRTLFVVALAVVVTLGVLPAASSAADLPYRAGRIEFIIEEGFYTADGVGQAMDAPAFVEAGRTFVPLRFLGQAMGAGVGWNPAERRVTLTRGQVVAELVVGQPAVTVNGRSQPTDVAPFLRAGRVYLPARFVGDAFGYDASWMSATRTVALQARYAFGRDWLGGGNVWVFGQPPLDYLEGVGATGTAWSVYWSGRNPGQELYVGSLNANGYRVGSNLPTMQGTADLGADSGLISRAACLDVNGRPVELGVGLPIWLACHNNPEWRQFLEGRILDHVDGGADVIVIDETAGDAGRLDAVCFCPSCLQGFRDHLASEFTPAELSAQFGIGNVAAFDYRTYLLTHGAERAPSDPNPDLRREYFRFQYRSRIDQLQDLIGAAQAHAATHAAAQTGRTILFAGNLFNLTPVHHLFADLFDVIFAEEPLDQPPGGQPVGTYLLARAMAPDKQFVGFPSVPSLSAMAPGDESLWRHWLTEAAACGCSLLLPYNAFTSGGGEYTLPAETIAPYTQFLRGHAAWYPGPPAEKNQAPTERTQPLAAVGLLYDLGTALYDWADPMATNFAAVAEALAASHIPFEVVYAGDGESVDRALDPEDLARYPVLVVPWGYGARAELGQALAAYAGSGGLVLRQGRPETDAPEGQPARVPASGVDLGLTTSAPGSLGVFPCRRGDTLAVHLVNHAYDYGAHGFIPQEDIEITLTVPTGIDLAGKTLKLMSPDPSQPSDLVVPYELAGGKVTFTVPSVEIYALAAFE